MTRKNESLTISVSPGTKEQLERLALAFDCKWGEKPNISLLIEKIADGSIMVGKQPKDVAARNTIVRARKALESAIAELEKL